MYRYRNVNTGDEVELPERSRRLDALANWLLLAGPPPADAPAPDPGPGDENTLGGVGAGDASGPEDTKPPARSASKAEWVRFAIAMGADPATADAMTKDKLLATYGGPG